MKQKKCWKIAALILAVVLLGGLLFFGSAFMGNPVSHLLASRGARTYLAEHYPNSDYQIESVGYSFKEGGYTAHIISPSSADSSFSVCFDMLGRPGYDDYESRVLNGGNTWSRLEDEYRTLCDRVLESGSFPYKSDIAYGSFINALDRGGGNVSEEPGVQPLPMRSADLVLDQIYDIPELGAKHGNLILYVEDDVVTYERAAEIMLDVKARMEAGGAPFYTMSFSLEPIRTDIGPADGPRFSVLNFPASDIYEEGMAERVEKAAQAAERFYAQEDASKPQ